MLKTILSQFKRIPLPIYAIAAILLINTFQFLPIERQSNANYRALNYYHDSGDIIEIGLRASNAVRQHYMNWHTLARVAPGSTVYIEDGGEFDNATDISRIFGAGQASGIKKAQTKFNTVLDGLDPEPYVIAYGEDSREGRRGQPFPSFAIALHTDRDDISLHSFGSDVIQKPKDTPVVKDAEFLLIKWDGPDSSFRSIERSEPYEYSLLLDLRLLPDDFKREMELL